MKIHGNYVGPNWSAGKHQPSVAFSDVEPIDEFDRSAQLHDRAYALGMDRKEADYKFFKENWGRGFTRSLSGLAVGAQGWLRSSKKNKKVRFMPAVKRKLSMPPTPARGRTLRRRTSRSRSTSARSRRSQSAFTARTRRNVRRRVSVLNGNKSNSIATVSVKKINRNKRRVYSGVTKSYETYGTLTGISSAYVGHATSVYIRVLEACWRAVIKQMAIKMCITVADFDQSNPLLFTGDKWTILYQPDTSGSVIAINWFSINNGYTLNNVVDGLYLAFLVALKDVDPNSQATMIALEYVPVSAAAGAYPYQRMDLKSVKINMQIVSSLKFQNQTNSGVSEEIERVDQSPLEGKLYIGTGTGTDTVSSLVSISNTLVAQEQGQITAAFAVGAGLNQNYLKDPPPAKDLLHVKYSQYQSVDPGQIIKHSLKASHNMLLNDYIRVCISGGAAAPTRVLSKIGKFAIFGMEKAIYNPLEGNNVTLVWEINQYFKAKCYLTKQPPTAHVASVNG